MAAAPEAPAGALFVVSLAAFAAAFVLMLIKYGLLVPIKAVADYVASLIRRVWIVGGPLADIIESLFNWLDEQVTSWLLACWHTGESFLNDAWKLTEMVGDAMADLANSTAATITRIVTVSIPNAVAGGSAAIAATIRAVRAEAIAAERTIRASVVAVEHAIATTIPATLGRDLAELRGWTSKQLRRAAGRLSRIEQAVSLGALAGVILAVIARELPWIRCRNINSVGKQLCGMPIARLEKLLAEFALASVAIFGTIDLRKLATDYSKLVGAVSGEVRHFWRADVTNAKADPGLGDTGL